jgi:hypothetical protein
VEQKEKSFLDEDMALLVEEMHSPCIENIAVFQRVARTVAQGWYSFRRRIF